MKKLLRIMEDYQVGLHNIYISFTQRHQLRESWGELEKNREFKNFYKGKRCFVIGNAPSLNTQDLSFLKDEIVLTCNQINRSPQFKNLNTNYHFWADPGFFKNNSEAGDKELLRVMMGINTERNHPICFFPLAVKDFVKRNHLDRTLNVRYFMPAHIFSEKYKKIDFTRIIPGMDTVVQYAIMLGIYMGCTEIYLLGCDCTGILSYIETKQNARNFEYAYSVSDAEAQRMKAMMDSVTCEQTFYGWTKVFRAYRLLGKYCEDRGIRLINSTNGGILDCLPREKYENVINSEAKEG